MADAQAQLRQHAEAMIRCVRQASAARAAEHPESVEAAAAARAALAAAEARAEAEASRRVRAESEAAERLRSQTAAEAALAEAQAALAREVEAKLALQAENGVLMRALRSAEQQREELHARLQTAAVRQQPQQMERADAAATAEVPAQGSDIETEGAQPEVGAAGEPATAATAAEAANDSLGSGRQGAAPMSKKRDQTAQVGARSKKPRHATAMVPARGAAGEPAAAANAAKGACSSLGSGNPRKVPGSNERKPTGDARVPAPVPAPVVPPLGPAAPAALPGEGAAAHAPSAWNYVLKHHFEESLESIDTTADGSCGFWCWLAFFSSCNHAVVRTREQLRQIKQKQIEAGEEMMRAMSRPGRPSRSRTPLPELRTPLPELHKPVALSDYDLLGQLVWHMNTDNATWEQVQGGALITSDLAEARCVVPATLERRQVGARDYMTTLHLSYFAIKLEMPVFAACEVAKETRKYEYFRFHPSGRSFYLESETALQAEMDKQPAPVAPLFLHPPLFLLEDNHWSLHQPRGEHNRSRSAKQARFQELFPQSS